MSIVSTGKINAANAGETISVPKANAIYNEIATASTSIDTTIQELMLFLVGIL